MILITAVLLALICGMVAIINMVVTEKTNEKVDKKAHELWQKQIYRSYLRSIQDSVPSEYSPEKNLPSQEEISVSEVYPISDSEER